MTNYLVGTAVVSANNTYFLGGAESLYVTKYGAISSINSHAVIGSGSYIAVTIAGTVMGDNAVELGYDTVSPNSNWLFIDEGGSLIGGCRTLAATIHGGDGLIENDGLIRNRAYFGEGVLFSNYDEYNVSPSSLVNTGLIDTNSNAVIAEGTGKLIVENTGTIRSKTDAFHLNSLTGSTDIENHGLIQGAVTLGAGNDVFDSRSGKVIGIVDGRNGADTLLCGSGNNTINGGAGDDSLYGGSGADVLTGGSGRDVFLFLSVADSRASSASQDTITDFRHGQDLIDLMSVDGNTTKSGLQDFHWIGTKNFSHKAGELHYAIKGSDTYITGDTNGDGKADFGIHLDDKIKLVAADFLLL